MASALVPGAIGAGVDGAARAEAAARARPPGRRSALFLTAVGTALTGLIAMLELDRLVSGALTQDLRSRSLSEISGPLALANTDVWDHWERLQAPASRGVDDWIAWYAASDVLFFVGYGWLLYRLVRGRSRVALLGLCALLLAETAETVLLSVAAAQLRGAGVADWLAWVLAPVTTAKWVFVLAVVLASLRNPSIRARLADLAVRTFRAFRVQRLSLFVAAVVAALSLIPAADIFDQFPDVVRGWFDEDSEQRRAVRHLWWGVASYLLAFAALFALGRQRAERSWTAHVGSPGTGPTPPTDPPQYGFWLLGPALALGIAVWLGSRGHPEWVDREVLAVFIGIPLGLVVLSLLVWWVVELAPERWRWSLWSEKRNPQSPRRALDVWAAGDLLAVAIVVIGALAIVRALVAPVALGAVQAEVHARTRLLALVVAAVVACVGPWLLHLALRPLDSSVIRRSHGLRAFLRPSHPGPGVALLLRPLAWEFWAAAIAFQAVLVLRPVQTSEFLGVVATAVLAMVAWAVILGFLIVHFQHHQPLEIFRLFHLRANPLLTLLLVVPLVASFWGGTAGLHDVRTPSTQAAAQPERHDIPTAFGIWRDEAPECTVRINGHRVRPMLLVAASGGGIRAASWTTGVLRSLGDRSECAASATFLSSGVSGGSVGLVLARDENPRQELVELAEPHALAAALAGTLVGDLVAGSSGLRIPSDEAGWDWRDRAALIETTWERTAAQLAAPYDTQLRGPGGYLLLNSTDAVTGCRVVVSQLDLDGDGDPAAPQRSHPLCGRGSGDLAASVDLRDTYGSCTPELTWATAALLSARFPTVTPGGRIPALSSSRDVCAKVDELQLVDGGYAEPSGLGTLTDIAPEVLDPVLAENAARDDHRDPVVVPIVLYLEDEPRTEIAVQPEGLTPELLVPIEGRGASGVQTTSVTWLQRAAAAYGDPCPDPPSQDRGCSGAVREVHRALTGGVVVAAPLTRPGVEVPLGWTLSGESRSRLTADVEQQFDGCRQRRMPYACTEQLVDLLFPDP